MRYSIIIGVIIGIIMAFIIGSLYVNPISSEENINNGDNIINDPPKQGSKNYISNDLELCTRIQFLCVDGKKRFDDEVGCGCQDAELIACTKDAKLCPDGSVVSRDANNNCEFFSCFSEVIFCDEESRGVEFCIEIYQPVCARVQIECITTPCDPIGQTFSNNCFACMNNNVLDYVNGEC